jgi:hypothetical protein
MANAARFSCLGTHGASSCYACDPCGTTWEPAKASIVRTSGPNDYCRVSSEYRRRATEFISFLFKKQTTENRHGNDGREGFHIVMSIDQRSWQWSLLLPVGLLQCR